MDSFPDIAQKESALLCLGPTIKHHNLVEYELTSPPCNRWKDHKSSDWDGISSIIQDKVVLIRDEQIITVADIKINRGSEQLRQNGDSVYSVQHEASKWGKSNEKMK